MVACGEWAWWHADHGYSRFYCASAGCNRPECVNIFWWRRIRLLTALIDEFSLSKFFTLTLDPEFIQGEDPWTYIRHPWTKFRKRMSRKWEGEFKFVAVLESHKNRDVPHIHGFTNVWMHQSEWSTLWHECCGGSIVWVEKVREEGLSEYVSKQIEVARYVGKEQLQGGYKHRKNAHTLWRSKGLKAKFELTESSGWCIVKENIFNEDGELTDWAAKKGVWSYGQEKCQGKDLEGTRSPSPEKSTQAGVKDMEAQESTGQHGKSKELALAERAHQFTDQEGT